MKRGGPIKQRSDKRVAEDRERERAKVVVRHRALGGCEVAGVMGRLGLGRCMGPFDFHEVLTRARGGSITDPDNILMVCRFHHDWITDHPVEAAAHGLVRNSWEDPGPKLRPVPMPTPRTGLRAANVRPLPERRPAGVGVRVVPDAHPSTDLLELRFSMPARPWTVNGERKWTPYRRAAEVKQWREDFAKLAHGSPALEWAKVTVHVYLRDMRDQDPGAAFPAYKAALDGVRDAGVLPDDDGRYVRSVTFYPPVKKTYDALELVLEGPPA